MTDSNEDEIQFISMYYVIWYTNYVIEFETFSENEFARYSLSFRKARDFRQIW